MAAPPKYSNQGHQPAGYWPVFCLALKIFSQMNGTQSAAAFAHYAFFSLFPLVILFVTIASIFIDREQAGLEVIAYVKTYVPLSGDMQSYIFDTIFGVVNARGQAGIIALLMLVWSAMQFFTTLISSTNQAWNAKAFNWWRLPFKSLLFLALMVSAVLFSVAMPVLVKVARDWLLPTGGLSPWIYGLAGYFLPSVVVFIGLGLFYKLAPNRATRFSEVWAAALCVTVLLQVAQGLFVIYLKRFATFNAVYGAFGGIMALLLWIYLSGCIVIFGVCLCSAKAELKRYAQNEQRWENENT
ncbi:YihY/virulence factor BrkB family protein [Methylovulum miyakonense]|uniref:YihY/virulence factor BrkB family protein n=1 Tax=Methylovulum miyakonense TaxID=645578 RepID=UPI00039B7B94|nr:YihY/virulence factor BrkB family protein [Methylovulum miyakonense]